MINKPRIDYYNTQETFPGRAEEALEFLQALSIDIPNRAQILDLGCYLGLTTVDFAHLLRNQDVFVTGIDLDIHLQPDGSTNPEVTESVQKYMPINPKISSAFCVINGNMEQFGYLQGQGFDLVLNLNCLSYDYYHNNDKDFARNPQAIIQRMGPTIENLNEGGYFVLWTEFSFATRYVLKKQGGKLIVAMDFAKYAEYLHKKYPNHPIDYEEAVNRDQADAQFACDVLNNYFAAHSDA
ncbi:MAG: class I SAM-dependent methyltransferase [Candidatus Doudnabacteria bacterium]|nr:class I SAM-dependent methyltransferase [Candidatus Doudnabacteria bacterium]